LNLENQQTPLQTPPQFLSHINITHIIVYCCDTLRELSSHVHNNLNCLTSSDQGENGFLVSCYFSAALSHSL